MTATAVSAVTVPAGSEELADQAAPLDALLVRATRSPLRRFVPTVSDREVRGRPGSATRYAPAVGWPAWPARSPRSPPAPRTITPSRRDRRFTDTAWSDNPLLRHLVQAYLATGQTAEDLVADADLDWRDAERVRFMVENLIQALAPSNVPLFNPASAKAVIDTAGLSLLRGAETCSGTWPARRGSRRWWTRSGFEVGRNIAATPGAVVLRTEMFELIQYTPQTEQVRAIPLLIVPPTINKNYAFDLAPGRSLVEYLVGRASRSS